MKFQLLLFILYKKLVRAASGNDRFQNFIKNKQLKFTIKTSSGAQGRQFIFDNGKISSSSNIRTGCDAAMVWCDGNTAFKVMASGNDEASVAALTEKKLLAEGSFKEFMWFSRALDIMMGKA
ncbi:MAG: hypothetical protein HY881_19390 [Deltaproteobacteria bacterium]|nr:hypothetical protein [Deltaproteobacteria bacterium]